MATPYGTAVDIKDTAQLWSEGRYLAASGMTLLTAVSVIPGVRLLRKADDVADVARSTDRAEDAAGSANRSGASDDGVSVSSSGRDLQATLPRPYINAETKRALGSPPEGMKNPHIHHVLEVNGRKGPHRAAVREGQDILRSHGIDPLQGAENLTWAPNKGHTRSAAEALLEDLRAADKAGLDREDILDVLKDHGEIAAER